MRRLFLIKTWIFSPPCLFVLEDFLVTRDRAVYAAIKHVYHRCKLLTPKLHWIFWHSITRIFCFKSLLDNFFDFAV